MFESMTDDQARAELAKVEAAWLKLGRGEKAVELTGADGQSIRYERANLSVIWNQMQMLRKRLGLPVQRRSVQVRVRG